MHNKRIDAYRGEKPFDNLAETTFVVLRAARIGEYNPSCFLFLFSAVTFFIR